MSMKLRYLLTISSFALAGTFTVPGLLAQDGTTDVQPDVLVAAASPSDPAPENAEEALAQIPAPENDVEAAAFAAFDKHCARCHQDGKLENRVKPASGFGNVLDLKRLAGDPSLVIPGNPDGSELVKQIASGNMPYDIKDGSNIFAPVPSSEEVAAIRNWIIALADSQTAACAERDFVTNADIIESISDDLVDTPEHRVSGMRYISLTHLYNACSTDEEMDVYRQGVIKLLNSLSTNSDLLKLQTTDAAETIIKFHLDDLKWTAAEWDRVASVYPYATKPRASTYDFVTGRLGTEVAYVRGDWFAFTASRPPLYHDLLKLPASFSELESALGVDVEDNIARFLAKRAGFQRSLVSQNNRLIERHSISTGYFWTSYDFAGNQGKQSLFEHPLGPSGEDAFDHDGGETIYSLPNGFQAYYLNTAEGARLDKGPTEIVRDPDREDFAVTNGISCMGCHDQGMRLASDDIRPHVLDTRIFPTQVRDAVAALYPPQEEMDRILDADTERFQGAMRRAGLDASLKLDGFEPINALSNRYEKDVHLELAAAEFGLSPDAFDSAASELGGDPSLMLRRLQSGAVPRDNLEAQFANLAALITDEEVLSPGALAVQAAADVARPNQGAAKVAGATQLTLLADKSEYASGDTPVFTVQSTGDCDLTLLNVDGKGVGTVLLPNKFQRDTFIRANQPFEFPGPDAPFRFRMNDPGTETVIALCNATSHTVDLIGHDFGTRAFTNVGDYERFATRAITVEAAERKSQAADAGATASRIPSRTGATRTAIKVTVK